MLPNESECIKERDAFFFNFFFLVALNKRYRQGSSIGEAKPRGINKPTDEATLSLT